MRHFAPLVRSPRSRRRLSLGVGRSTAAQAGEAHAFIIAANDGYGLQDCLGEGGECGRVVADAWCEAQGHGAALSFGRAETSRGATQPTPSNLRR